MSEFMPLDNWFEKDIPLSHDVHCVLTNYSSKNDLRRFSKATPSLINRRVQRIWDHDEGVPKRSRIIHDISKAADAMLAVMLANGKVVPNLVKRNGHRN